MTHTEHKPWLHWFAVFTAIATLALISIGGLVTSHGVGMSVPDWPTTYGYNMFLFPVSKWLGGILYEHTHRLVASFVGVLVVALTRWLGGRAACKPLLLVGGIETLAGVFLLQVNPKLSGAGYFLSGIGGVVMLAGIVWIRNEPAAARLQRLGWLAFGAVQLQGLLGGLRVVLFNNGIGVFHAALAQAFLVLLCAIALLTSRWWRNLSGRETEADSAGLRRFFLAATLLIFGQLVLGATMRHEHAGLSIPDFPLAYHKLWPPMDAASVASYNVNRLEVDESNPITAFQIGLQMAHRLVAVLIFCAVVFGAWIARRHLGGRHPLARISLAWLGLVFVQIILGASTIWSHKAADVATAHVVAGALLLTTGALLTMVSFRVLIPAHAAALAAANPEKARFAPGKPVASNAR